MVNMTLAELVAQIPTVTGAVISIVLQVLDLMISNPLLFAFIGCAFVGIGIKYGRRMLFAAKKLGN